MRYEFVVAGRLSGTTLSAFPELSATLRPAGGTSLFGPVRDDAEIASLLARFGDLGLRVLEMRLLPD